MKLKILMIAAIAILAVAVMVLSDEGSSDNKTDMLDGTKAGLKAVNLMVEQLALAEGVEVVVSHIEIPANMELPKHWHPGEEFVYILEGSAIIWQKDKPDTTLHAGDLYKIPLKAIHTARTTDQGAKALVFRVHERGKPTRTLVE